MEKDDACEFCQICGDATPHQSSKLCGTCLDGLWSLNRFIKFPGGRKYLEEKLEELAKEDYEEVKKLTKEVCSDDGITVIEEKPPMAVRPGMVVAHAECQGTHTLQVPPDNATKQYKPGTLVFHCDDRLFIGALNGELIPGLMVVDFIDE